MPPATTSYPDAFALGRAAALAAACARDLRRYAAGHADLFSARAFDEVCATVAHANAFGAPWHTAGELRTACRSALWVFALDWLVDHVADERGQVRAVVAGCEAVAGGAEPATPLTRMLADLRRDLRRAPAFAAGYPAWREELSRMLAAMAREWDWKQALRAAGRTAAPTLDDYLDNAANFGSTWVNVAHWIAVGDAGDLGPARRAADTVQRALRLANDLRTYARDVDWGDLNALMLGVDRATVTGRIGALRAEAGELLDALAASAPRQAEYLRRQLDYSLAFYGSGGDYWG